MRDGHNGESKYQYVSTQSKAIRKKKKFTSKVSKTLINTQKKKREEI